MSEGENVTIPRARYEALMAALKGMIEEWDRLSRYGSPMAKAANERVANARAALRAAGITGEDDK